MTSSLFRDADDVVDRDWLSALADAAHDADIVGGHLDFDRLNEPVCRLGISRASPDSTFPLSRASCPGCRAATAGCGPWWRVTCAKSRLRLRQLGIEFSWRAQLAGYRIAFARQAVVYRRRRPRVRAVASQWCGSATASPGPSSIVSSGVRGMPLGEPGAALWTWGWLLVTMPRVIGSRWFAGTGSGSRRGAWAASSGVRLRGRVGRGARSPPAAARHDGPASRRLSQPEHL